MFDVSYWRRHSTTAPSFLPIQGEFIPFLLVMPYEFLDERSTVVRSFDILCLSRAVNKNTAP